MTLGPALAHLLSADPAPLAGGDDPARWYLSFHERALAPWLARANGGADSAGRGSRGLDHFAHALLGGFVADRPAWAMVAGHQAAVRRLAWERGGEDLVPVGGIVAFCASEEGGAHPRAVHSSLRKAPDGGFRLDGGKRWATLAPSAAALLVIASLGRDGDRNRLRALCVPSDRRGIRIAPMAVASPAGEGERKPPNPEVRHAVVDLSAVPVAAGEVMDGDGYTDAIKPFRTIEDLYIEAAATAYNLALARRSAWPEAAVEDLLLLLVAAEALAAGPLDAPAAHLGVAALSRATARVRADHAEHWTLVDEAAAAAWRRDAGGGVAARARELRRRRAWARLAASST